MSHLVLASHLPGEGHYRSRKHRVLSLPCVEELDYSRGLQAVWPSKRTLIVLEHDMECSDDLVDELLDCPEKQCTHAYLLYWVTTHQAVPHYAQRDGGPNHGEWVKPGTEWCGFTGIGFCKITPEARTGPLADAHWSTVDCTITRATAGPWHIHWQKDADGRPAGIEHWHR